MSEIRSLQVRLSDVQKQREIKQWTSDNIVVKEEEGDIFYGKIEEQEAMLQREYEEEARRIKEFKAKYRAEDSQLIITDSMGSFIKKKGQPFFTQESITVMKGAIGDSSTVMDTLINLGSQISEKSPENIEAAMNLNPKEIDTKGKKAIIGTFNIAWLGTKKRKESDYKMIAGVITDSEAQLLGIQEVSNEEGLKKVLKYLPDYGYILGKSGGQKVAVLFDKKRVKYDINSIDQITEAKVGTHLRAPLLVDMKIDNTFDFTFVVAHLKAMFDDKSIATRTEQAKRINKWISEHLEKSNDKDLIFVGDFNDFVGSDALKSLQKGKNVHFLTEGLAKEFYSNIPYKGLIDHCTVTNVEGGAMDEVIPGSIHTIDEKEYPGYLKSVSDHKPVLFIVKTDKDND